jgi:hypothetical protein
MRCSGVSPRTPRTTHPAQNTAAAAAIAAAKARKRTRRTGHSLRPRCCFVRRFGRNALTLPRQHHGRRRPRQRGRLRRHVPRDAPWIPDKQRRCRFLELWVGGLHLTVRPVPYRLLTLVAGLAGGGGATWILR